MIYRFQHSMYYANAEHFSQEVFDLVNSAQPPLSWFCIDATAMDDVDFSAAATLRETYNTLKEKGVRLVLAEVDEDIRRELDLSEVTDLVGKDAYFETVSDVEDAYRATVSDNKT
jgi:sulfate permease, SulP family